MLDRLVAARGLLRELVLDIGPELAGTAPDQWAYTHGVQLRFIAPGQPAPTEFVESFSGRPRDECLTER